MKPAHPHHQTEETQERLQKIAREQDMSASKVIEKVIWAEKVI